MGSMHGMMGGPGAAPRGPETSAQMSQMMGHMAEMQKHMSEMMGGAPSEKKADPGKK